MKKTQFYILISAAMILPGMVLAMEERQTPTGVKANYPMTVFPTTHILRAPSVQLLSGGLVTTNPVDMATKDAVRRRDETREMLKILHKQEKEQEQDG